jgi:hypothetical protein
VDANFSVVVEFKGQLTTGEVSSVPARFQVIEVSRTAPDFDLGWLGGIGGQSNLQGIEVRIHSNDFLVHLGQMLAHKVHAAIVIGAGDYQDAQGHNSSAMA